MWVRRNEQNVIVEIREKAPETGDIIPTVPRHSKEKKETAAGQGD